MIINNNNTNNNNINTNTKKKGHMQKILYALLGKLKIKFFAFVLFL